MDTNFSLADIAAVMGRDREGAGLFGGGGVLAIIIILFLLFSMKSPGWNGRSPIRRRRSTGWNWPSRCAAWCATP